MTATGGRWRRAASGLEWSPDGGMHWHRVGGVIELPQLLDFLHHNYPLETGRWLDRCGLVDKHVTAAAIRALQHGCLDHPIPRKDPGCPRCVRDAVLELCARIVTGEHIPNSPAAPHWQVGPDRHSRQADPAARPVPGGPGGGS